MENIAKINLRMYNDFLDVMEFESHQLEVLNIECVQ